MNIGFLTNDITGIGGSKKVTCLLANEMAKNNTVKIISLFRSGNIEFDLDSNIEIEYLYNKEIKLYELSTYKKMVQSKQYKEVFALFLNLFYISFTIAFKFIKVRKLTKELNKIIIPEIYGLLFTPIFNKKQEVIVHLHHTYEYIIKNKVNKFMLLNYKNKIHTLVVLTDKDKENFSKYKFNSITRIYNPINGSKIKRDFIDNRIIFIGRLDFIKGIDYLKEIILSLRVDFILEVYGEGPLRQDLEQFVVQNKLQDKVKIKGFIQDIPGVLKGANCLLNTSRHEGLPMTFLEAFQCEVPIVASESFPAIKEIIQDGINGYVYKQEDIKNCIDKIEMLINDKNLNNKLGKGSGDCYENFEMQCIIKQWNLILEKRMSMW